ncbi:hypothetical protein N9M80_03645 [Flavobacteriales bacterium]|nr:hypothetical protein [Flavobacteriales bacterium]
MNRLFLLLFGAVSLVAHAQVPDYVPTDGLISWYSFDETTDDTGAVLAHFDSESVGFQSNRFGIENTSAQFNGTSSEMIAPDLDQYDDLSELTISFWLKFTEYPNYQTGEGGHAIFMKSEPVTANTEVSFAVLTEFDYDALRFNTRFSNGIQINLRFEPFSESLTLNSWHHVVCRFDGTKNEIFWNGYLGAQSASYPQMTIWNSPFSIMTNTEYGNIDHWQGGLDDLGTWSRALTEEEILALYNAPAPAPGCTDPTACNFDAEAMSDDGSCIPSGCLEPLACNFNALAECEGEACDYSCCPGPGCCLEGTVWDAELGGCIPMGASCPEDLDFDGVVGVNDLMELLSAFGTDCPEPEEPETTEFTCGGPLNYHGYEYATVQIGDQCWFAENLRTEQYANGDSIPGGLSTSEWQDGDDTNLGAQAIYNNDPSILEDYGRLYNSYAVNDARGLCPSGWHVPTDGEWMTLEMELGMTETEANSLNFRGTDEGAFMKSLPSDDPSWNGTNTSGFSGLAGGQRDGWGGFYGGGYNGYFWTSSAEGVNAWYRALYGESTAVWRNGSHRRVGFSIRCLID